MDYADGEGVRITLGILGHGIGLLGKFKRMILGCRLRQSFLMF